MRITLAFLLVTVLWYTSGPILAHHAFSSEFDRAKPIDVVGVITRVEWQNPHVGYYADVKDASGKATNWYFRAVCPSGWIGQGIARDDLKIGVAIRIQGFQARDGSKKADGEILTFPNGRTVSVGYGAS